MRKLQKVMGVPSFDNSMLIRLMISGESSYRRRPVRSSKESERRKTNWEKEKAAHQLSVFALGYSAMLKRNPPDDSTVRSMRTYPGSLK